MESAIVTAITLAIVFVFIVGCALLVERLLP